jgi:hypothetical protein
MDDPGTRIASEASRGDDVSFLFDAIMPALFYPLGISRDDHTSDGEILVDALRCFQRDLEPHHLNGRKEFNELSPGFSTTRETGLSLPGVSAIRWTSAGGRSMKGHSFLRINAQ